MLPFSQRQFLEQSVHGENPFHPSAPGAHNQVPNAEKIRLLEEILHSCKEHRIRLLLFFHPRHALLSIVNGQPQAPNTAERQAVNNLVAQSNAAFPDAAPTQLWDFADFHPINCEPIPTAGESMKWWSDLNHYTPEIGYLILGRMLGWPVQVSGGDDYGMRLDPESLPEWEARVRGTGKRYAAGPGAADIRWKENLLKQSAEQ